MLLRTQYVLMILVASCEYEEEGLHFLCTGNKGADHSCSVPLFSQIQKPVQTVPREAIGTGSSLFANLSASLCCTAAENLSCVMKNLFFAYAKTKALRAAW